MIYQPCDVFVSSRPLPLCYDDERSHAGGTVGTLSPLVMSHLLLHATHASLQALSPTCSSWTYTWTCEWTVAWLLVPAIPEVTSSVKPRGPHRCWGRWFPLWFEINDQVDRIQPAFILRSANSLEGTQQNRHKVMRQQNRESPRLTARNLCRVFHNILFLCTSSWSLSPSPSSPRSAAWRRRTTWIFWSEWYRKVSSVDLFL